MSISVLNDLLTRRRMRQYALALFLVTAAFYVVGVARSRHLIEPSGRIIGRDYFAFYMAGDMVHQGRLDRLYDPVAQQEYQRGFMRDINPRWTGTCLYLNPPHFAWAMSLIAPRGYGPSLVLWWLVSLGCFVVTALIWRSWLGPRHTGLAVTLAVCMPAWFQAFAGGQNTFISLLILTLFCKLLINHRPLLAGLVLSLLGYKFPLLVVPMGWLVVTRRWRAAGGVLAGGVLTLALTAAFLGPGVIADYVKLGTRLGGLMQQEGFDVHKQCSWYGFFALAGAGWMPTVSTRILTATACVASLLLLVPISRVSWPSRPLRLSFQLSALLVATLATSPHLFHYDMLLATLPAVLWLRAAREHDLAAATGAVKGILALGFAALAVMGPLTGLVGLQPVPVLMVLWLVVLARAAYGSSYVGSPGEAGSSCTCV